MYVKLNEGEFDVGGEVAGSWVGVEGGRDGWTRTDGRSWFGTSTTPGET